MNWNDYVNFLNDHLDDVGMLETTVISKISEISTFKTNIPTLPISANTSKLY
jgi:hypothetical protein